MLDEHDCIVHKRNTVYIYSIMIRLLIRDPEYDLVEDFRPDSDGNWPDVPVLLISGILQPVQFAGILPKWKALKPVNGRWVKIKVYGYCSATRYWVVLEPNEYLVGRVFPGKGCFLVTESSNPIVVQAAINPLQL